MLEVRELWVDYGTVQALQGAEFSLTQAEFVVLLGRNGAGKSSLLHALMGQAPVKRGRILWNGREITRWSTWKRVQAGLALVPEGRRVFAHLSVRENLELGAFVSPKGFKRNLEYVLSLFPLLKERLHLPAGVLSGGEQQMLAMARALMGSPKLLLLDEPSMGLAPKMVQKIYAVLGRLKGKVTMLVVEQNLSKGLSLADRLLFFDSGRVVKEYAKGGFSKKEVEALYLGGKP